MFGFWELLGKKEAPFLFKLGKKTVSSNLSGS